MGNLRFSAGSEGNLVYNKAIDVSSTRSSAGISMTKFEVDYSEVYGKLALGLTDYVNVYTKLGAVTVPEARMRFADGADLKIETDTSFKWAVGGTATYTVKEGDAISNLSGNSPIVNGFFAGLNNEFNMWGVDVSKITINGNTNPTDLTGQVSVWEYQLTGYIGHRFAFDQIKTVIKPYVGMVWDYFHTDSDGDISYRINAVRYSINYDLHSNDQLGIVVGSDVAILDHVILNVEGRFVDETAISFGGSVKF